MAVCGARTDDGTSCQNPVRRPGLHCWRHGGPRAPTNLGRPAARPRTTATRRRGAGSEWRSAAMPDVSASTRPSPSWSARQPSTPAPAPPPSHRQVKRERVREAAVFCADTLSDSWQEAVADRATDYAQTAWQRLSRSRRKRNCKALARMAQLILKTKTLIHKEVGGIFARVAKGLGASDPVQAFTAELASKIPLPGDAQAIAVARGLQVAGILLCVMDNRDLTKCECFIDLALAEAKERVNAMLVAAMSDWANLAQYRPLSAQSTR